jgi:hypothetical protein
VLDNLDHSVLRDRIGWHLVGLNVMNKLLRALGLVCLSVGLVRRTRHRRNRRRCKA